ncbi:MAG: PIN/TRAM domain-containing protein [Phycisphaerales bacterium]
MTRDHEDLNKRMLLRFIRIGFVALMLIVVMLYVLSINRNAEEVDIGFAEKWWIPVITALVLAGVFLAMDLLTPRKKISLISGVVFGLMAGLMAAWVFSTVIDLVVQTWDLQDVFGAFTTAIKVLMGVALSYLGITMVLQTQDEFRLVIPYVEFAKEMRGPMPLVLDTSALIDARIADIAASGLIQQTIVIPEFVLEELQVLADARDRMKRNKGRRGLDIANKLQKMSGVDVVLDSTQTQKKGVDLALVELCGRMPAMLVSLDVALVRIATIQKIRVLNVNDLANALKPVVIPGKMITVELIKPGEQHGQAVGYLEDGTMVVAEDGYPHIGQTRELVITSSMQTAAGRLLFARVDMAEMETTDREHAIQEHRPPSKHDNHDNDRGFSDGYGEEDEDDGDSGNDETGIHPTKPASISGPRIVNRPGDGGGSMKGTPRNPRR